MSKYSRFKIQPMEPKTLLWWRSRQEKIDMEPPYQRKGKLWSSTDKAYLIDSILNGFDVPKLYLADFTWGESPLNDKRLPYAIIDGKQRLEAIFDFFDGSVVLNEDFIYRNNPSLSLGGLSYKDLKANYSELAELFENFSLSIVTVFAADDEPINELFVRLNRSKSLTGAEIRNAMGGPAPELTRKIANHSFFTETISFSVKRGAELNSAAKFLLFEYNGTPGETKKRNLDQFVKDSAGHKDQLELAAHRVFSVLEEMSSIFLPADKLLASEGILPVYYWFIRNLDMSEQVSIREFLVAFDAERRKNRQRVKDNEPSANNLLAQYERLNRSTNDLASHKGRIEILNMAFEYWKRHKKLS